MQLRAGDVAPATPETEATNEPSCDVGSQRPERSAWDGETTLNRIRNRDAGVLLSRARGSRGEAVRLVQKALLAWGCEKVSTNLLPKFGADGVFGQETEQAVMRFQRSNSAGEASVQTDTEAEESLKDDGVVGPNTLGAQDRFIASPVESEESDGTDDDEAPQPTEENGPPPLGFMNAVPLFQPRNSTATSTEDTDTVVGEPVFRVGMSFPTLVGGLTGTRGWAFHAQEIVSTRFRVVRQGSDAGACGLDVGSNLDEDYPYQRSEGGESGPVAKLQGRFQRIRLEPVDLPAVPIPVERTEEGDRVTVQLDQRFRMHLIWDLNLPPTEPNRSNAKPVSLGSVDWSWQATATFEHIGTRGPFKVWRRVSLGPRAATGHGIDRSTPFPRALLRRAVLGADMGNQFRRQCGE